MLLYTALTKKALRIAFDAHKKQVDKSGLPYVYHPFEVASAVTGEYETCVALLHDVVEDTEITLEDLSKESSREIIDTLRLLTHDEKVPYFDYVRAIRNNAIAKAVKLADLQHNSNLARLDTVTEKDLKRVEKYKKADKTRIKAPKNASRFSGINYTLSQKGA